MIDTTLILRRLLTSALLVTISACSLAPTTPPPPLVEIEIPSEPAPAVSIPVPESAVISELPNQDAINPTVVPVSPTVIVNNQQSTRSVTWSLYGFLRNGHKCLSYVSSSARYANS